MSSTIASTDETAFALGAEDRRRISVRLSTGLSAVGLLALASVLVRLRPEEWQVAEALRAIAALVVGVPTLVSGARGLISGDPRRTTDQLVALAIIAAAAIGQFTTATIVPLVLEVGRLFEERSALGARAAIEGIRKLAARQAVRVTSGYEERVEPEALVRGDLILVRPGERIAVDGTVREGRASIDPSAITGESLYQEVQIGSTVYAGTLCLDGLLRIEVESIGAETILGRVVTLLAEVENAAVPMLRLFERRAGVWLPLVLTIAATALFFTHDLSRAITVLVVATPTTLVVAGPAAMIAGMSVATRLRTLIKSPDFFERTSEIDTLILDKTGTVTMGAPVVAEILPAEGHDAAYVLAIAAACGSGSLHPMSRALVTAAAERGIVLDRPEDLVERPGLGVIATVAGHRAILGRRVLLEEMGIAIVGVYAEGGGSEVWIAYDDSLLGRILLRDLPRTGAHHAVEQMRVLGIDRVILLTGDRAAAANEVGDVLGVDRVVAEVLPAQKLELVREQQREGRIVMMVGDGVNDAPALAGADVGIAIGAELNEVALGGADVAIVGTDLQRIPRLVQLADKTRSVLGQNVWLAFGLSGLLVLLAAAGVLQPITGAIAQSLAVIVVVVNSTRVLGKPRAIVTPSDEVNAARDAFARLASALSAPTDHALHARTFAPAIRLERYEPGDERVLAETLVGHPAVDAWLATLPVDAEFSLVGLPVRAGDQWHATFAIGGTATEGGVWEARLAADGRLAQLAHRPFDLIADDDAADRLAD